MNRIGRRAIICSACGKRGADVRPDFSAHKQAGK
jgi:hypothetical protein